MVPFSMGLGVWDREWMEPEETTTMVGTSVRESSKFFCCLWARGCLLHYSKIKQDKIKYSSYHLEWCQKQMSTLM